MQLTRHGLRWLFGFKTDQCNPLVLVRSINCLISVSCFGRSLFSYALNKVLWETLSPSPLRMEDFSAVVHGVRLELRLIFQTLQNRFDVEFQFRNILLDY